MANTNLETYLEAILEAIRGGEIQDVPTPNWNYEKYLAGILAELKNGGGGGGGVLVVNATIDGNTVTLDKTWQEIVDADFAVMKYRHNLRTSFETLALYRTSDDPEVNYWVNFGGADSDLPDFSTSSPDGYPSTTLE